MLLAPRQPVPATPRPGDSSLLRLFDRHGGQLHELPPGRTTIGSSPKCSLRLERPGVQPLHCLILHGPDGVSIRCWAPNMRLNGERFVDAPIAAGDCLSIADFEFEVVNKEGVPADEESARVCLVDSEADCDQLMDVVQDSVHAITELDGAAERDADSAEPAEFDLEADFARQPVNRVPAPDDAAEIVFRELQTACALARGRVRRMLAALRSERQKNRELLERAVVVDKQIAVLSQPTLLEGSVPAAMALNSWQVQWEELRQQFSEWGTTLIEHTRQMAELQTALAVAHEGRPLLDAPAFAESGGKPVDELVAEIPPPSVLSPVLGEYANEMPLAWEVPAANSELAERLGPPSQPLDAAGESPCGDEQNRLQSEPFFEEQSTTERVFPADEWSPPRATCDVEQHGWEQAVSRESQASERESHWVPADSNPWDTSTTDSPCASKEPDPDATRKPAQRESCWNVGPLPAETQGNQSDDVDGDNFIEVDAPVWAMRAATEASTAEKDVSSFAEFSIWKQGTAAEPTGETNLRDSELATPVPAAELAEARPNDVVRSYSEVGKTPTDNALSATAEDEATLAAHQLRDADSDDLVPSTLNRLQPSSFIERYSHLFEDGGPAADTPMTSNATESTARQQSTALGHEAVHVETALANDEEESIEQYMAKLMQRVRGESATTATVHPTLSQPPRTDEDEQQVSLTSTSSPNPSGPAFSAADKVELLAEQQLAEPVVDWNALSQRVTSKARKTDIGALRALANETARRAIGRHELLKHRRDAMTKVIVSVLAGMTSLWLMLEAPSWRDIQFITACVALAAAAYWAGEAFREMLESWRAAAYDGPPSARPDIVAEIEPSLPIDVEDQR